MNGTTTAKPTTVKLDPNIPVRLTVKYVDVWPNDLTRNEGKGYGPSLCLTGTRIPSGEPIRVYPPGKLWASLKALQVGGVIAVGQYDEEPAAKYSIPVQNGVDVELVLEKLGGAKYADLRVNGSTGNGQPPVQQVAPAAPAPVARGDLPGDPAISYNAPQQPPAPLPNAALDALADKYVACLDRAIAIAKTRNITDQQATVAVAATLFIALSRGG